MAALFFDTSALARRYVPFEPGAQRVRALCRRSSGNVVFISRLAPIEMASALNRRLREGSLDLDQRNRVWRLFRYHERSQYRVLTFDEDIYRQAERLLFAHRLRAYDALQLACAMYAATMLAGFAAAFRFCTADRGQALAAADEGLIVELIG